MANWKQKDGDCLGCKKKIWRVSKRCDPCNRLFKSKKSIKERFFDNAIKSDGCWKWNGAMFPNGYGSLFYKGRNLLSHKVSYEIHNGEIPAGKIICHQCDNKWCCNPAHLFIDGYRGNAVDAIKKGLKFGRVALSSNEIIEIRNLSKEKTTQVIADEYHVSRSTIQSILSKKTWTFI